MCVISLSQTEATFWNKYIKKLVIESEYRNGCWEGDKIKMILFGRFGKWETKILKSNP